MLSDVYLHPNGQIPAYEWNFGDVNPPVHAWATLFAYHAAPHEHGGSDIDFLRNAFKKLLLNFTWWVNRKDPSGRNLFEGGFLGLDNIGVFDRSAPLPTGGQLEQADGTAWMALFSQNMLELAIELATVDPSYEDLALKFVQHFFQIAGAMDRVGETPDEMWDEEDGFFYDVLRLPDGTATRLRIRSMVGLIPLCAVAVISPETLEQFPSLTARVRSYLERNHDLLVNLADPQRPGVNGHRILSVLNEEKLRRVLNRMLDEERFLSPHGVRSLSRSHLDEPYVFTVEDHRYEVGYLPAESDTGMFGGNSNWRGPVWFPINLLIIRALLQYYKYYGDSFTIECPTGSGHEMTLFEVAKDLADRLISIFLRNEDGDRPVYGGTEKFQQDPHWRDLVSFHEYFHGDNGAGIGASHQTGWTGTVARLIQLFGEATRGRRSPRSGWVLGLPPPPVCGGVPALSASRGSGSGERGLGGPWPAHPVIYELSTLPWLNEIGTRTGHSVTLADVPAAEWDSVVLPGVDAIWLMGVWERSPVGRSIALGDHALRQGIAEILPDATDEDIVASPYCVRRYRVEPRLGGPEGLAIARAELAGRGVRLLLDFVPNHVAPDHDWVETHPEYFVRGTEADLGLEPPAFLKTTGGVVALGRDPYFPPWPDVVQLDPTQPALRAAVIETLSDIAKQCDGVRCDMAMLQLDDVVAQTWGERVGRSGAVPYWREVTGAVQALYPNFLFVAEAYWDREPDLIAQGFDHCYDKRLYDRLISDGAGSVRDHLSADPEYQRHLVRFLENHDEPRAAAVFPPDRGDTARLLVATVPGALLLFQGQFVGRRLHMPVQLGRWPDRTARWRRRGRLASPVELFSRGRLAIWTVEHARGEWMAGQRQLPQSPRLAVGRGGSPPCDRRQLLGTVRGWTNRAGRYGRC